MEVIFMRNNIRIITKKQFVSESDEMNAKMRKAIQNSKNPLMMEVRVPCKGEILGWYWFSCGFTPWRLFATFFVKGSKYYKARIDPEYYANGEYWKGP